MALKTTTIGSFPKPDWLPVTDWFRGDGGPDGADPAGRYAAEVAAMAAEAEDLFLRAAREAIDDQTAAGIDIPTDGEVRRENYIHYHCRHLDGIDFDNRREKVLREGSYRAKLPVVVGPVAAREAFLVHDWRAADGMTDRSVKATLPGPLTIFDTVVDGHYGDERALCRDLAAAVNVEVLRLAEAGCRHIQVDEPLFARRPEAALAFGIENLERCFHGIPEGVFATAHMCCGYPDRLDNPDYPKAPPESYFAIAGALEDSAIDAVSLEDAHRHNDLTLLESFTTTTVILGVVAIARSHIESAEEIGSRLDAALEHIDARRLMAAPDCGLGMLTRDMARAKLKNLCVAAAGRS